jgi:hypothetical protein
MSNKLFISLDLIPYIDTTKMMHCERMGMTVAWWLWDFKIVCFPVKVLVCILALLYSLAGSRETRSHFVNAMQRTFPPAAATVTWTSALLLQTWAAFGLWMAPRGPALARLLAVACDPVTRLSLSKSHRVRYPCGSFISLIPLSPHPHTLTLLHP